MSVRATVLLVAATMSVAGGCTEAQQRAIDRALSPPPVDIRAVPGGVAVGFVCGPGTPMYSELDELDSKGFLLHTVSHTDYRKARATRSVVLPVPLAVRGTRLTGFVALDFMIQPGVPFGLYVFEFRYSDLPRSTTKRIAGGDCRRYTHPTSSTTPN